jgi:hypothetical protein
MKSDELHIGSALGHATKRGEVAADRSYSGPSQHVLIATVGEAPVAASVCNPPSDPVTQFAEAPAILVAHDNQTRLGVLGDVRVFLAVGINSDHAAGGRPSIPTEGQSALDFVAGRAFK